MADSAVDSNAFNRGNEAEALLSNLSGLSPQQVVHLGVRLRDLSTRHAAFERGTSRPDCGHHPRPLLIKTIGQLRLGWGRAGRTDPLLVHHAKPVPGVSRFARRQAASQRIHGCLIDRFAGISGHGQPYICGDTVEIRYSAAVQRECQPQAALCNRITFGSRLLI